MAPSSKLAKREAIMQSSMSDAPGLPLLAIRGHLCFRCLEHAEKLLRCKGCQRAVYCSKECQANDWRIVHRHLCKSLREVNDIERQEDAEHRSWEVYTESLVSLYLDGCISLSLEYHAGLDCEDCELFDL